MSRAHACARLLYLAGSLVFLGVALSRGSVLLATGSVLFTLGSLLLLRPLLPALLHTQRNRRAPACARR